MLIKFSYSPNLLYLQLIIIIKLYLQVIVKKTFESSQSLINLLSKIV